MSTRPPGRAFQAAGPGIPAPSAGREMSPVREYNSWHAAANPARQPSAESPASRRPVLPLVPDLGRPPDHSRPLPDATSVRRLAVPDSAPPYDDESSPRRPARRHARQPPGTAGQPARQPSRTGQPSPDQRRPARTGAATPGPDGQPGQRLARQVRPGARGDAGRLPAAPADRALDHRAGAAAHQAARTDARGRRAAAGPPRRSVAPGRRCVEMTVVVRFGPRVRALAVRLERDGPRRAGPGRDARRGARWRCTAAEAGLSRRDGSR